MVLCSHYILRAVSLIGSHRLYFLVFGTAEATGTERQDGFGVVFIETGSTHGQVRVVAATADEGLLWNTGKTQHSRLAVQCSYKYVPGRGSTVYYRGCGGVAEG